MLQMPLRAAHNAHNGRIVRCRQGQRRFVPATPVDPSSCTHILFLTHLHVKFHAMLNPVAQALTGSWGGAILGVLLKDELLFRSIRGRGERFAS